MHFLLALVEAILFGTTEGYEFQAHIFEKDF